MFKKIELGTLLLYQNNMTLSSMIGRKWKKNQNTLNISPIRCINAGLVRQLVEDCNYLLVSYKSHCRVFSTFYFCLTSGHAIFFFSLQGTCNTIPLSLIWNLNKRKNNNPSNLVPLSPSESEADGG